EPNTYLKLLNRILYANISRIKEDRSMTMVIITYINNRYYISGQHESVVICRKNGDIEVIDTMDNGFYVGMTLDVPDNYKNMELILEKDDVMLLYSDGVTEAENVKKEQFGITNLCDALKKYHQLSADKIKEKFMKDLYNYMGETEIYDDISLVVIKQR
ncbi:MAG TPA: SpoIIE family protein phosphatase, partial [Candidatus Goldiibacteriota bacterium]|nr:SpoIIE family protein phosphatase [Candidatus Goldiibacteriota bacterium]